MEWKEITKLSEAIAKLEDGYNVQWNCDGGTWLDIYSYRLDVDHNDFTFRYRPKHQEKAGLPPELLTDEKHPPTMQMCTINEIIRYLKERENDS